MKGVVFNVLQKMVEEKHGLETWDALITETAPASEGVYTSGETYPATELLAYVDAISKKTNTPVPDIVRAFGEYALPALHGLFPQFFEKKNLSDFLKSIDDVIHVEVQKLYPEAELPKFTYAEPSEKTLQMNYTSARKLCFFAEGLIQGSARHFNEKVEISQPSCEHEGGENCQIQVKFSS